MYLRTVKVKDKKTGIIREYLRIVSSYKEKGVSKQKVIAHLGRVDLIKPGELTKLAKKLARFEGNELYSEGEIHVNEGLIFGPVMIIRKIWEELGLGKIISSVCKDKEVGERVFVLTCCRLLQAQSEYGLSYFLRDYYVCDKKGKRWEPFFIEDIAKKLYEREGRDRVKVEWKELMMWYRSLDKLIRNKERIELEIYERVRDIFSLEVDVVFYDITSTYFEGRCPEMLSRFGYSRDERNNNRQVLLGMVMANGLPVAHHVFAGNISDKKTVEFVIKDLKKRFKLKDIIFVGDRGMMSLENIKRLEEMEYRYIMGVSIRNCGRAKEIIDKADRLERKEYDKDTRYTCVEVKEGSREERWILIESSERGEYEKEMREEWIKRGAEKLQELKERVKEGRLKDKKKIAYYLGRISRRYHIQRYFDYEIEEGEFRFWISKEKVKREEKYEGRYLLRTTDKDLREEEVIKEYKRLWEVELSFKEMKDFIEIRPIYHKREERVRAHIFIAVIGYLLEKVIEKKLRWSGVLITAKDGLNFSKVVKVVELEVGGKKIKLITQKIDKLSEKVFNCIGIKLLRTFKDTHKENFIKERCIQRKLFY